MRIGIAFALGIAIAALDNFAFGGETSPIFVFGLLLMATGLIGFVWRSRGWLSAALLWACVPAAHLIKHVFGLSDTLQPNTYASILMLAAITLVVAVVGTACGTAVGGPKKAKSSSDQNLA
jgi:CDP-diglyceride synthetase